MTMEMTADPAAVLERKMRERLRNDESHRRISTTVTEVAMAAMHPARHLGVGRRDSRGMLEDSIEQATQAAVETLITRMEDLVDSFPQETVRELAAEQVMAEHGLE